MHGSCTPAPASSTLLVARRPPCLPPVTYCRFRRCPNPSSTRAARPHDEPASSARARLPYASLTGARPDLELDPISHPGPVPIASQHCWRHGVRLSAGCHVAYYLLTVLNGAWPPLEPLNASPRAAALSHPSHFSAHLTHAVRALLPAQCRPRLPRRSGTRWAGHCRGCAAGAAPLAATARDFTALACPFTHRMEHRMGARRRAQAALGHGRPR